MTTTIMDNVISALHYSTGWGSGLVTGGVLLGDLLGGGGVTGSGVGDTGSSSGISVYLLTGCPIRATADPPYTDCQCRHSTPKRSPFHRHSQFAPTNVTARSKVLCCWVRLEFSPPLLPLLLIEQRGSPSAATRTGRGRCLDSHCIHRRVGIDICGGRLGYWQVPTSRLSEKVTARG